MRPIFVALLFVPPIAYVVLMKATNQAIDPMVLLMMIPFLLFPIVVPRFLPKMTAEEEDKLARDMGKHFALAATGHISVAVPSKKRTPKELLSESVTILLIAGALIYFGRGYQLKGGISLPSVGIAVGLYGAFLAVWNGVKLLRSRSNSEDGSHDHGRTDV